MKLRTIQCAHCDKTISVDNNGRMRQHRRFPGDRQPCLFSGRLVLVDITAKARRAAELGTLKAMKETR